MPMSTNASNFEAIAQKMRSREGAKLFWVWVWVLGLIFARSSRSMVENDGQTRGNNFEWEMIFPKPHRLGVKST